MRKTIKLGIAALCLVWMGAWAQSSPKRITLCKEALKKFYYKPESMGRQDLQGHSIYFDQRSTIMQTVLGSSNYEGDRKVFQQCVNKYQAFGFAQGLGEIALPRYVLEDKLKAKPKKHRSRSYAKLSDFFGTAASDIKRVDVEYAYLDFKPIHNYKNGDQCVCPKKRCGRRMTHCEARKGNIYNYQAGDKMISELNVDKVVHLICSDSLDVVIKYGDLQFNVPFVPLLDIMAYRDEVKEAFEDIENFTTQNPACNDFGERIQSFFLEHDRKLEAELTKVNDLIQAMKAFGYDTEYGPKALDRN